MAQPVPTNPRFIDMTGKVFGRLAVLSYSGRTKDGQTLWECLCQCGKTCTAYGSNIRKGHTQSCGCYARDCIGNLRKTHGLTGTREYHCWVGMLQRCTNPKAGYFHDYGGRGIKVCDEWKSFETFYRDMGPAPGPEYTLDRFPDMNGDYCPANCRWATRTEQNRNKRSNRLLEHNGESKPLAEWAEITGLTDDTIRQRLQRGWSVSEALTLRWYQRARKPNA